MIVKREWQTLRGRNETTYQESLGSLDKNGSSKTRPRRHPLFQVWRTNRDYCAGKSLPRTPAVHFHVFGIPKT